MKLTSPAFTEGKSIPEKYTCDGKNILLPLMISDVPANAKSLALVMDDPDAVRGTWDHWVVWNIAPETKTISEGTEPKGILGTTSKGDKGFHGPCPPDKEHRYFFKIYALDTMLDIPEGSNKKQLETAMKGHIITQAQLMGRYNRPQNR